MLAHKNEKHPGWSALVRGALTKMPLYFLENIAFILSINLFFIGTASGKGSFSTQGKTILYTVTTK